MWKAWRRESQQRAPVDLLVETSLGGSGAWDRVSGANLSDASLCSTGDSNQIHMRKDDGLHTAQCDHHTSARVWWWELRLFFEICFPVFNKNDSFPPPQPHTRGSAMHMQPRSFTQPATVHLCSLSITVTSTNRARLQTHSQPSFQI